MKIVIATGIYPPQIGGPAQYAKELADALTRAGNEVVIKTYRLEYKLPTGIRHLYYFFKILPTVWQAEVVIALDTFSVGLPAVAAGRLLGTTVIIRTGGDFLWEGHVERTGTKVLFRDFYHTSRAKWNLKEKIIFALSGWTLRYASKLVFSTTWQRDIFTSVYKLDQTKIYLVNNFSGPKLPSLPPVSQVFVAGTRPLKWKNLDTLKQAFVFVGTDYSGAKLDLTTASYQEFLEKIKSAYAVILVSLGDISPNLVLDALRFNKPVILTKETGFTDLLEDTVLWVDPLNIQDITEKIKLLLDPAVYQDYVARATAFNYIHTWDEIASEFTQVIKTI
ncbi:MAG: glycosyltransferase family 4 protein [Candidatus Vogelbacteria bacterium]|nr:glycosyltransferase family 4 protein [Candidatus Vogelbacteria bacterium]